jgi:hypothetical protein
MKIEKKQQLEVCRQQAALEAATARLFGLSRSEADQVKIEFDWQIPGRVDSPITFQVCISRRGQHSAISFAIDLSKLTGSDLQQLHDFLVQQHAGLGNGYTVTRSVVWLLSLSLRQQGTAADQIDALVRNLLLC